MTLNPNNLKSDIAKIVGIENSDAWDIIDSDPDNSLYLINYNNRADLSRYGQLSGVVVDVDKKTIVCRSDGYCPTAVKDVIDLNPDNKIHIIDNFGEEHVFDQETIRIKIAYEGQTVRVFKHNGTVYYSTNKNLNLSKKYWQYYNDLNGPLGDDLFDVNSLYSPYCHIFIMVHPELINVTKGDIGDGYLVYLGPKQLWSYDNESPYNESQIDKNLRVPPTVTSLVSYSNDKSSNNNGIIKDAGKILYSININLDQANHHLKFGFYDPNRWDNDQQLDQRTLPGESIIIYNINDLGQISTSLKVNSSSYQWRSEMRDNNHNIVNRFYQLIDGSYIQAETDSGFERYHGIFPIFALPYKINYSNDQDINTLVEGVEDYLYQNGPIVMWPPIDISIEQQKNLVSNENLRLVNIWISYLMSVPLDLQNDVLPLYRNLIDQRDQAIDWLINIQYDQESNIDLSDQAKAILSQARQFAQYKTSRGDNNTSIDQMINKNIHDLVMKQSGDDLYKLITNMKSSLSNYYSNSL